MQQWHCLNEPRHTWAAFKTNLLAEQKSEQDTGFTPASAYANNVNGIHETAEELNHLAQATAADQQAAVNQSEAVANLTMSNQNLAQKLQQAQTQLQQVLTQFQRLNTSVREHTPAVPATKKTVPGPTERTPLNIPSTTPRGKQPPRATRRWHNTNYCFSCGFIVAEYHTSTIYQPLSLKPNHQETVTKENMMGGSDRHWDLVGLSQD